MYMPYCLCYIIFKYVNMCNKFTKMLYSYDTIIKSSYLWDNDVPVPVFLEITIDTSLKMIIFANQGL